MKNREKYAHYIASLAQKSILYEVSTTPKPGLVDQKDSGAHKDMDFFTFLTSSAALYKGLYDCALEGILFDGKPLTLLFENIRPIGINCEKDMFTATNGINTHKGIIFSLGILCAAVGNLYKSFNPLSFPAEKVCDKVKEMTKDLIEKDFKKIKEKNILTHGEVLYKNYGLKGIREEVENGFPTVRNYGIPILRSWNEKKPFEKNDLFLEILLHLMAYSQDTNVVSRGGIKGLEYVQITAQDFLKDKGMRQEYAKEKLLSMNEAFIKKNVSPGGSADLLAVTIFLGLIEGIQL